MTSKPAKPGLKNADLKEFERRLREQKALLSADVRGDFKESQQQGYAELVGEVRDSGDESHADQLADSEHAQMFRHADALSDVEAALERIRDGSFGLCVDCGGEIGIERLRASPTAKRCINCQAQYEKQHVSKIGPSL